MGRIRTTTYSFVYSLFLMQSVFFSSAAVSTDVEYLNSPAIQALNLPFSEAVRVGNTLYLSGQLGNLPGTHELVEGGRKDYKVDCIAAEFKDWEISWDE